MDNFLIDIEKQRTLQFSGDLDILMKTIASLSTAQMNSPLFKSISTERYLSALRVGGYENAEMTKNVFRLDPFFVKSKLVQNAAIEGFRLQVDRGHLDVAAKIKEVMYLPNDLAVLPEKAEEKKEGTGVA